MNKFIIMTDSTTDLPEQFYAETGVKHQPHGVVIDGVEFADKFWTTIPMETYYEKVKSGVPMSTTQPQMAKMYSDVEEAFKNGQDALYICFSSKLSGTYNTTRVVAADMEEKYPGRCLYTVDTSCASRGEGMLVMLAAKMQAEGASLDDIIAKLEVEKDKIYHLFTVDDLHHLKRGGRLSATSAVMGTLIGIKPILHMSDEGLLLPIAKVRGRNHACDELVKMAAEKFDESTKIVYICHVDCINEAQAIRDEVKTKTSAEVEIYNLGPAISTHCGVGTVGIIFHSEK